MTTKIGTRDRQTSLTRTEYRPINLAYNQNPGCTYTASTITFTAPNQINDSANGFNTTVFAANQLITVQGSDTGNVDVLGLNSGRFIVLSSTSGQILTVDQTITTDTNAQTVTIYPA
jgi:hypothetical protein